MEQSFKRIADSVCLSESSRTRIRAQIAFRAEEQEASMQNNSKKHLPRLAVAAIIIAAALTLTAAAAAVVHRFRNDIIVTSVNELPEPTEDTPMAVAVVTDQTECGTDTGRCSAGRPIYHCRRVEVRRENRRHNIRPVWRLGHR